MVPPPTLEIEKKFWSKGHNYICGIDEVGRGSWAGPLVVAGVILPAGFVIPPGLADSKLVNPTLREKLSKIIRNFALGFKIVQIDAGEIDKVGLAKATHIAFRKTIKEIEPEPDFCLIDAFFIKHYSRKNQLAVKFGDKVCASISAASIVAKVYRDDLMKKLDRVFPEYGFAANKGYGTKFHQDAIRKFGLSKIHRMSYHLNFLSP